MSKEFVVGDGRTHLDNELMGASLIRKDTIANSHGEVELAMLPDLKVVAIGGRSIMDRGRAAVFPLVEELVAARADHEMLVGASGGARLRHVFHIALDLGLPTGALAQLAGPSEEQNVAMLQQLMGRHRSVMLKRDDFADLPMYLAGGRIPLTISVPPYHYWEPPPEGGGRLPDHGSDTGMYLSAEAMGAARCIFVKDVDGLYTDDPATNADATFIPRIGAQTLLDRDLPSLIIDRVVLQSLQNARFVKEVQIINGLVAGNLTRALNGEHVGTIIHQER
ncbi:MAG: uridine kinase [Alphaproteobacteria bacterium]|nr:uridine kinase [Alphaproteobacteria bacterium]